MNWAIELAIGQFNSIHIQELVIGGPDSQYGTLIGQFENYPSWGRWKMNRVIDYSAARCASKLGLLPCFGGLLAQVLSSVEVKGS